MEKRKVGSDSVSIAYSKDGEAVFNIGRRVPRLPSLLNYIICNLLLLN